MFFRQDFIGKYVFFFNFVVLLPHQDVLYEMYKKKKILNEFVAYDFFFVHLSTNMNRKRAFWFLFIM